MSTPMKLSFSDLNQRFEELTGAVSCECVFATECVGGLPADKLGLEAFIHHYLNIKDPEEAAQALARISKEEVNVDLRPEEGELEEKLTYGVRIVRKTDHGPYLGNWMLKAALKQAASRLDIFKTFRGSKGNFAEAGRVYAIGDSLKETDHPERIYVDMCGKVLEFKEFMGRVQSPKGAVSIVHHSEVIPPGTRFSWQFRYLEGELSPEDIRDVLALMMIVGLGSARSLERGKFRIESAEIMKASDPRKKPVKISPKELKEAAEQKKIQDAAKEIEKEDSVEDVPAVA